MAGRPSFFDLSDRYEALCAAGDPLERLAAVVDFEVFRGPLVAALRRSVRGKGGRPPFDPVLMFKILVLQAIYSLADEATEFQIKDRLSFQRFLGLGLDGTVPDATAVLLFRERLVQAKAIDRLFARFDTALKDRGYLAMGGQIIDATVAPAPKQRNTEAERAAIKEGADQDQLDPISAPRPKNIDHPGIGIAAILGADQRCERVWTFTKIHRTRRDHHARASAHRTTGADHRTAFSASITAAIMLASAPRPIFTATPSISSSMAASATRRRYTRRAGLGSGAVPGSTTAGTNDGSCGSAAGRTAPAASSCLRRPLRHA